MFTHPLAECLTFEQLTSNCNAEFGIAAHWSYKEQGRSDDDQPSSRSADSGGTEAAFCDAMHTSWARMLLQYGHEIRDYNKNVLGSRSPVLRQLTQNLMAVSPEEVQSRQRLQTVRRRTLDGSDLPSRSRTFADHVAAVMMQPQRKGNVYIVVDSGGSARIDSLQAVLGASTVGHLLEAGGLPPGVDVAKLHVNGLPITTTEHPLYMGDVVSVVENVPALLRSPMRALAGAPAALGVLQKELYGLVLTNMGRPDAAAA